MTILFTKLYWKILIDYYVIDNFQKHNLTNHLVFT